MDERKTEINKFKSYVILRVIMIMAEFQLAEKNKAELHMAEAYNPFYGFACSFSSNIVKSSSKAPEILLGGRNDNA